MNIYEDMAKALGYEKSKSASDKTKTVDKNKIKELWKTLDSLEKKLEIATNEEMKSIKIQINDAETEINKLANEEQIENDLVDESSPLESGRYDGMNYKQMVAAALQGENEATEIALALIEKADNEEDIKKFVEIANDENDHSLTYQGILNRLNGLSS